ncbi:helix-turn-helix domain-containing protein [Allomesorhizobium alhagi]|uniref:HTH cro/C1-type domain-containing protein n=1 Tax=Mesorhizobium alhagi CCNWXJ12-2 TaxID=1107882 RepID=H0I2I9_9HYPH|nr:helix-turn-helix domain-containing protein [Mesorhizobium alhagi]EHK52791.1 hypothetical protein MAXJ12_33464 [Mesorhizobium alhagi CCNWXJ12-2]
MNFIDIGKRIRDLRKALGDDNANLFAAYVGWSPQQLSNYENSQRRHEVSVAIKPCVRTGATVDYICRGEYAGLPLHLASAIQDYLARR